MGSLETFASGLKSQLSASAKIVGSEETIDRWDGACAPTPQFTVIPTCEQDVPIIVRYCRQKGLKCLTQTGGHGWRVKNKEKVDVIISMRELKDIEVAEDKKSATISGGILVGELNEVMHKNGLEFPTGVCNSVGVFGSLLFGGVGRYMGRYGLSIDNLISLNFVDASGKFHENVTEATDADLWWALKGAGTAFGIVTKATVKVYPQSNNGVSWSATLIYSDTSKLEAIVKAFGEVELTEDMCGHILYCCAPPTFSPVIMIVLWYYGDEKAAQKAWKSLFDLEPVILDASVKPSNRLNDGNDPFGDVQGRKPGVGLGIHKLEPESSRKIWESYVRFITENPEAGRSVILTERFPRAKTLSFPRESACFGNRDSNYEMIAIPWYDSPDFDNKAKAWTSSVRKIWVDECSHPDGRLRSYGAFSGIDEPLESLYGGKERVDRLKAIKQKWDPENIWDANISLV